MTWTIESVLEARVDPAAVFSLYLDPATWSRWGHNATWAHADGPLVEGGTVDVKADYGTVYHCRIRRLEPGRALELVVKPPLLTIINIYEVEPTDGGARIRHAFDIAGPIVPLVRLAVGRTYQRRLDAEVAAVARLAADPDAHVEPPKGAPPIARAWGRLGRRRGRTEQPRTPGGDLGT